eukprot:6798145-Prymnesium_polylepis.3
MSRLRAALSSFESTVRKKSALPRRLRAASPVVIAHGTAWTRCTTGRSMNIAPHVKTAWRRGRANAVGRMNWIIVVDDAQGVEIQAMDVV